MRDVSRRRVNISHKYEYTYAISLYARGYAWDYVVLFRVTETIMLQLACQQRFMVQVSEAMLLPLCKTKVCKECDSTACYARHQVQGMRPLFIPCPLSYAVCVFTRISTSVYGLCVLLRFMDNASTLYVLLSCNNPGNLMRTTTCNQLDRNKSHAIHDLNTILHNMYDSATYDMNLCGCDLMSSCAFNISVMPI